MTTTKSALLALLVGCTLWVAIPGLSAELPFLDIALNRQDEVKGIAIREGHVFLALFHGDLASTSVRRLRADGRDVWQRQFPLKASMAVQNGRVLVAIGKAGTSGRRRVEILRASDGTTMTAFDAPYDSVGLSAHGDAIVSLKSVFDGPGGNDIAITNIDSGKTHLLTVGSVIGGAVAMDSGRVLVQRVDGLLERYDASGLVWSQQVGFSDLSPVELSPTGSFALVKLAGGAFSVVNVTTGGVTFSHNPLNPDALPKLGVLDVVRESLQTGTLRNSDGSPAFLLQVAANWVPMFDDDVLVLRSIYESLPAVRVNLRNGRIAASKGTGDVRRALEQESTRLRAVAQSSPSLRVLEEGGLFVVSVPGHLLLKAN